MLSGEGVTLCRVRRGKDRRRHLVQQRLKYVVVAAVDQQDGGIGIRSACAAAIPAKLPPTITTRLRSRQGAATTKLPRQAGARPTLRSWITSFGLFAIRRYSPMAAATRFWGQMG